MSKKFRRYPKGPLSVLLSKNPSCGKWGLVERWNYWRWNYSPEWKAWFLESVLGRKYLIEYIMNGVSLGGDHQLSRRAAEEMARSFAYAYSWAILNAVVTDENNKVVFDTTVRLPTPQELRQHAESSFPEREGLEYRALMEYADHIERDQARTEQKD